MCKEKTHVEQDAQNIQDTQNKQNKSTQRFHVEGHAAKSTNLPDFFAAFVGQRSWHNVHLELRWQRLWKRLHDTSRILFLALQKHGESTQYFAYSCQKNWGSHHGSLADFVHCKHVFYVYFIPMFASGPCYHPVVFRCSELCETTLHRGVKSKKQWGCQSTNEANHLASLFWSLCVSYHCSFLSVCPLLTCICLFGCIVLLLQTVLLWNSPSWILQTPNLPALCFLETMRVIDHIIPHLPGEGC